MADIYRRPLSRHWEAPRRTTVDAVTNPRIREKINRRLKPHRRPCAHFWSGSKPYGGPPRGERSLLPQLLTTDIRALLDQVKIAVEEVVQETCKDQAVATPALQERAVVVVKVLLQITAATAAMEK